MGLVLGRGRVGGGLVRGEKEHTRRALEAMKHVSVVTEGIRRSGRGVSRLFGPFYLFFFSFSYLYVFGRYFVWN